MTAATITPTRLTAEAFSLANSSSLAMLATLSKHSPPQMNTFSAYLQVATEWMYPIHTSHRPMMQYRITHWLKYCNATSQILPRTGNPNGNSAPNFPKYVNGITQNLNLTFIHQVRVCYIPFDNFATNRPLKLTFSLLHRLRIQRRTAGATGGNKPITDEKYHDNHVCPMSFLCKSSSKIEVQLLIKAPEVTDLEGIVHCEDENES
jgi:hypothetical protein